MHPLKYLLFILILPVIIFSQDSLQFKKNPNYNLQIGFYEIYKAKNTNIVMLGNSITHGVNWNELLNRSSISEQGIVSDILEGYLYRLKYVTRLSPKICFIMGGINDIYSGIPVEKTFETYKKLISELKKNNIHPVIQSTLYVSQKWHSADIKNPEITQLNMLLQSYAAEEKIEFIDLNEKLSINNQLIDDYTIDGVHLNSRAYKIWGTEVEKVLNKYHL